MHRHATYLHPKITFILSYLPEKFNLSDAGIGKIGIFGTFPFGLYCKFIYFDKQKATKIPTVQIQYGYKAYDRKLTNDFLPIFGQITHVTQKLNVLFQQFDLGIYHVENLHGLC